MRFVLLHHSLADGKHWDLMLEHDDALATWQLPRPPRTPADLPMPARRLGDHRKAYLTYQGPISRGRGRVRRVDEGHLRTIGRSDETWEFELTGLHLSGPFRLRHLDGDAWVFEAIAGGDDAHAGERSGG